MKILIIGATGMIGHRLWIGLSKDHVVHAVVRKSKDQLIELPRVDKDLIHYGVDVIKNFDDLATIVSKVKPDVVFNCVGIVKQLDLASNHEVSIELNALFPHKLAKICRENEARMIQFSSDCVFDGKKGNYSEDDIPNATDLYGKSKALGEIDYLSNVLTLRTSFLGREIYPHGGLIHWFESQNGKSIKGFSKAIYSGLPAQAFIKILNDYILPNEKLSGLYHLSSESIDKFNLLLLVREIYNLDIKIEEESTFEVDRSLNSNKLKEEVGLSIPSWKELVNELLVDDGFYKSIS